MSFAVALLLAQAAPLALPDDPPEIVVIARKLSEVRADWAARPRNGKMRISRCRIVQSSGDKELDRVVCQAVRHCAERIAPAASGEDSREEFNDCVREHSLELGEALFARRETGGRRAR